LSLKVVIKSLLKSKLTFLFPIDFIRLIKISIELFVRLIVDLMIKFNLK